MRGKLFGLDAIKMIAIEFQKCYDASSAENIAVNKPGETMYNYTQLLRHKPRNAHRSWQLVLATQSRLLNAAQLSHYKNAHERALVLNVLTTDLLAALQYYVQRYV